MKYLITGVAGFIGSSLLKKLLAEGNQVVGIDSLVAGNASNLPTDSNFQFIHGDIRDRKLEIRYLGIDVVFHFAGITSLPECQNDPGEAYSVNVAGTAQVFESARRSGVRRVVFASTSAVYENSQNTIFLETDFVAPDLIYSHTKIVSEEIARNFSDNYNMPISILRFFNVYGPQQNYSRKSPPLLGYICRCVVRREIPEFYSNGDQKRDYIYVDDLLDLVARVTIMSEQKFEILNVCSGKTASVRDIYKLVQQIDQGAKPANFNQSEKFWQNYEALHISPFALNLDRITKEVNKYSCGSYEQAKINYGWEPTTSLELGIQNILNHAYQNKENLNSAIQGQ